MSTSDQSIRAQRLRLFFRSSSSIAGAALTAILTAFILWPYVDRRLILLWSGALIGWTCYRFYLWTRFRRDYADDARVIRWTRTAVVIVAVSGMLWAAIGAAFYLPLDIEIRAFVLFVWAGMVAGGTILYSPYLPALASFVITSTLPFAAVSLWHGTSASVVMAALILFFNALGLSAARTTGRMITSEMRLKIENDALVQDLRKANRAAEAARLEAEKTRAKAEDASRVKSEFLANMSHELRTPLNAIIGFSEMIMKQLLGENAGDRYKSYAQHIHASGQHLLKLVNDILDLSKLEAGNLELSEDRVDIAQLIDDCVSLISGQAKDKGIAIAVDLPVRLPRLLADELRLKQILLNLLSNAVKFSAAGPAVTVAAKRTEAGGISLSVIDRGIGMRTQDIPVALQPFRQVDNTITRRYEGTGLGLPLAKILVERHGGTLALTSALGVGTTVTATFPKERVEQDGTSGDREAPGQPGARDRIGA